MKINYSIELLVPAVTASLGTIGKGVDIEIKRDKQGKPYFSGKHIKGILRERVGQFKEALTEEKTEFIKKYFGEEGKYTGDKNFSKLIFSNLIPEKIEGIKTGTRHGIRIDRRTRTTMPNSLFNYEFLEAGNIFYGEIEANDNMPREDLKFILTSLFHLNFIGGLKSRGLGKVEVKINNMGLEDLEKIIDSLKKNKDYFIDKTKAKNELERYSYELKFIEPLILKSKELSNYVEVRKSVQGSTIRGALIEFFVKNGLDLEDVLKIEASDAMKEKVSLASSFKTKYKIKEDYVYKDKAQTTEIEVNEVKLERNSEQDFSIIDNEISIKIDPKTRSVESGMLFNTEFIAPYEKKENKEDKAKESKGEYQEIKLKGDVRLPKDLIKADNSPYEIYLGKLKTKGFGKAEISFRKYEDLEKMDIEERIKKFNDKVEIFENEEKEKLKDKKIITFDLLSDLVLPFNDVYDAEKQFKTLSELDDKFEFLSNRSFINSGKLEGYNIINNVRKIDELVFLKGSVFTFAVSNYEDILGKLKEIEETGIGLRKNEGFGRVKICSLRGDN